MKTLKRTTIAILILTLLFSLAIPTMAANDKTITINNTNDGHVYGAYQIFTGSFSDGSFVNVEWGTGFSATTFITNLKNDPTIGSEFSTLSADASASEVAKILSKFTDNSDNLNIFAKIAAGCVSTTPTAQSTDAGNSYTISVPSGYYLVKDDQDITGHDSETMYILDITKEDNVAVNPKNDIPTVEKKVLEDTDIANTTNAPDGNFNDAADWDIGQTMQFRLYGTIPANFNELKNYETYQFIFEDTFDAGITVIEPLNYTVAYRIGDQETVLANTTFTANLNAGKLTFTCADLKAVLGDNIYNNPTIVITYDAMLNENAVIGMGGNQNGVTLKFSNEVYGTGTGTTPYDKVIVFTYDLGATKIDGDTEETLAGAEFKLMNATQDKYAVVENGKFVEWVDKTETNGTVLISADGTGKFIIQGLDADTYYLEEINAPKGYNALTEPLKLEITASYNSDDIYQQDWDTFAASNAIDTITLEVNDEPTTDFQIANFSGFNLPETGGFGTTLIYLIGGILVIGVSVILISRKRMSNED